MNSMDTLITGGIALGIWWYITKQHPHKFVINTPSDEDITRAIDPITGNPAIVDPPLRAGIGSNISSYIPFRNTKFNERMKPYDTTSNGIFKSKDYLKKFNLAWEQNFWDAGATTPFLDTDKKIGNNMVPELMGKKVSKVDIPGYT